MCAQPKDSPSRQEHIRAYDKMKENPEPRSKLPEEERLRRIQASKQKYNNSHHEKRKECMKRSNLKKKAKKQLEKEGIELSEENVNNRLEGLLRDSLL